MGGLEEGETEAVRLLGSRVRCGRRRRSELVVRCNEALQELLRRRCAGSSTRRRNKHLRRPPHEREQQPRLPLLSLLERPLQSLWALRPDLSGESDVVGECVGYDRCGETGV